MWFPIMIFAATGYEHSIANMAYVPLGLMYGADADYKKWLYQNLLLVILGNIVGGGIVVGGAEYFLFDWTRLAVAAGSRGALLPIDSPLSQQSSPDGNHMRECESRQGRCSHGRCPYIAPYAAVYGGGVTEGASDPARVREVFAAMDSDGDGALDARELACALHALGFRHPFALLHAVVRARPGAAGGAERFDLAALEEQARIVHELEALGLTSRPSQG
jgi:hypothetical protein